MITSRAKTILIILLFFSIVTASAEQVYSESFGFSGTNSFSELVNNPTGGYFGITAEHTGVITYMFLNFDNGKRAHELMLPSTIVTYAGARDLYLSTSSGENENFTTFTATVSGQAYGSGYLGWRRTSGTEFNYIIHFSSVNNAYADTLAGQLEVVLTYDHNVFSDVQSSTAGTDVTEMTSNANYGGVVVSVHTGTNGQRTGYLSSGSLYQYITFSYEDTPTVTFNNDSATTGILNVSKHSSNYRFSYSNSTANVYDVTSTADISKYVVNLNTGLNYSMEHIGLGQWVHRTVYTPTGKLYTGPTSTVANTITTDKATYLSNQSIEVTGNYAQPSGALTYAFVDVYNTANLNLSLWKTYVYNGNFDFNISYIADSAGVGKLAYGNYTIHMTSYNNEGACQDTVGVSACITTLDTAEFNVIPNSSATRDIYAFPTVRIIGDQVTISYTASASTDVISVSDNSGNPYIQWTQSTYPYSHAISIPAQVSYIGNWTARITNASNLSDYKETGFQVINDDGTIDNNYGAYIYWEKKAYLTGERAKLQVHPGTYNGSIMVTVTLEDNPTVTATTNTSGISVLTYQFNRAGRYWAYAYINSSLIFKSYVDIGQAATPTPTPGAPGMTNSATTLLNVFTYTAFYGLIIFIGIIYGMIRLMTRNGGSVDGQALVIVMAVIASMLSLIGLFDPFKYYILVLTWILAGLYFKLNRNAATGPG